MLLTEQIPGNRNNLYQYLLLQDLYFIPDSGRLFKLKIFRIAKGTHRVLFWDLIYPEHFEKPSSKLRALRVFVVKLDNLCLNRPGFGSQFDRHALCAYYVRMVMLRRCSDATDF